MPAKSNDESNLLFFVNVGHYESYLTVYVLAHHFNVFLSKVNRCAVLCGKRSFGCGGGVLCKTEDYRNLMLKNICGY